MSGINRVLGICLLIIIAQRLIKFTEGYPVAVTCFIRFIVLICITVLAIQLVICIIVIQRTGNIFCVWFFRKFDQALSDYYKKANAQYPIYTGHFQPSYSNWGYRFDAISAALNLWGLNNDFKDENRFMAINNSTINEDGVGTRYDYAYQGLVANKIGRAHV